MKKRSLLHSLCVVVYVAFVAMIMQNGDRLFGKEDTVLVVMAILLLFCVSAAVVGSLVFGYPVVLFLNGQKKEGIAMALSTIGWLAVEMVVVFGVLVAMR